MPSKLDQAFAKAEAALNSRSRPNVTSDGTTRWANDVTDALAYRAVAGAGEDVQLSDNAAPHVTKPLWAIAAESLEKTGQQVDAYGPPELIAERAMAMGTPGQRHTFYSPADRLYCSATPVQQVGDFPNILANLANKIIDTIPMDDDYSYPLISAVLPGGLKDFKPAPLINRSNVEELDEIQDGESVKDLGFTEEVSSYVFLRRFGNKFGLTPVMIANDDMNVLSEGLGGLLEAWQVTQNRLVAELFTTNPTLMDGAALFSDRTDTGSAANDNIRTLGAAPNDTEWLEMDELYADIGGIDTGRRVRGSLNVAFVPTGEVHQEARRTFDPMNIGVEQKVAATTDNVGVFRGKVTVVPESELRIADPIKWYGLRNPTQMSSATVVRGYFNGYGQQGRRESWYDPTNKTSWVSLEGRIATAVKNWGYAIRNAGTGA